MTANDVNRSIAQAGQRAGAAIAAGFGALLTERRVREIVREELTAVFQPALAALTESTSAFVHAEVVEDLDERASDQGKDIHHFLDVLRGISRRLGQLGVRHIVDERSALNHAPGDLDEFIGTELRHEASPSSVGSTPSVGERSDTGGDPAGSDHPKGGAQ